MSEIMFLFGFPLLTKNLLFIIQIACKAISMIGDPKAEIVRKITDIHADALVMGSRNLGTIKR